jgi:hypothetical protein
LRYKQLAIVAKSWQNRTADFREENTMSDTRSFRVGPGSRYFNEVREFQERTGAVVVHGLPVRGLTLHTSPTKVVNEAK